MPLLARKLVLLAKIETGYGTDPTPTGVANAIQVSNAKISPLEAVAVERQNVQGYLGNKQSIVAGQTVVLEFDVEIAGAGTAGNAPGYAPLLRGCGMGETLSVGTSAVYKPVSTGFESLTFWFNVDGLKHALLGARGSFSMKFDTKGIPVMAFKFTGLYTVPTDAAAPTPTLTAFQQPLPMVNAYTSAFTIHSIAAILASLSVDLANNVVYRNLVGSESVIITDRQPSGSVTFEATTVGTKDWWSSIKNSTLSTLSLTHGTAAGNKFKLDLPSVQLEKPAYSEQDGVQMLQLGLSVDPTSTGNDEVQITVL
jgi:hypothetical protein